MKITDFVEELKEENPWMARWIGDYEWLVQLDGGQKVKCSPPFKERFDKDRIVRFGTSGTGESGSLCWVGWDLDVGHGGKNAYDSPSLAVEAGMKIAEYHDPVGDVEVRYSQGGKGVHVRVAPRVFWDNSVGRDIARGTVAYLDVAACPAALGRQLHWLWARETPPNGFRLIWTNSDVGEFRSDSEGHPGGSGERARIGGTDPYTGLPFTKLPL